MSAIAKRWLEPSTVGSVVKGRFGGDSATSPVLFEDAASSELMRRFQTNHDGESFAQLYRLNAPRIGRIVQSCLRFGARDLDGDQILQDVFVSVFRSAHRFRFERDCSFRRWSAQIARNAVRHALRERRERKVHETGAVLEVLVAKPQRPEEGEVFNAGQTAVPVLLLAMAEAVERLAPRDREVLTAADAEGESYAAIGARRRMRRATVRMVVFRARRRWFEQVEALLFAPGSHRRGGKLR
jgi:RNA polymerase sigma-70 factor, ECF subfamily